MYRLIIIDDEKPIRMGIAQSIPWKELGFEISGFAADGAQAVSLIEEHHPHIVLTDIRMPNMDGIDLMQYLNEKYPSTKIVVLSGYADYEYMNKSIRYSVAEYLLKPTNIDDFIDTFTRLKAQLDEEEKQRASTEILLKKAEQRDEIELVNTVNLYLKGYADQQMLFTKYAIRGLYVMVIEPDNSIDLVQRFHEKRNWQSGYTLVKPTHIFLYTHLLILRTKS